MKIIGLLLTCFFPQGYTHVPDKPPPLGAICMSRYAGTYTSYRACTAGVHRFWAHLGFPGKDNKRQGVYARCIPIKSKPSIKDSI